MNKGNLRVEALSLEIFRVLSLIDFYCKQAPKFLAPQKIKLYLFKHKKSTVHFDRWASLALFLDGIFHF